jgi:hypothetical protein
MAEQRTGGASLPAGEAHRPTRQRSGGGGAHATELQRKLKHSID